MTQPSKRMNFTACWYSLAVGTVCLLAWPGTAARAGVEFLGCMSLSGNVQDGPGDGAPADAAAQLGGFSGLDYLGRDNRYVVVSDPAPTDRPGGAYARFHMVELRLPRAGQNGSAQVLSTVLLQHQSSQYYLGGSDAFDPVDRGRNLRFDGEGVRVTSNGDIAICDEFGPAVTIFSPKGQQRRALAVPDKFLIAHPAASKPAELRNNRRGRQANRGMEGLAITPDGTKLYGIMQNALLQDAGLDHAGKRLGLHNRIVELDLTTGATREFVYRLADRSHGVSEILAISGRHLLVLERDGQAGAEARFKQVALIDLQGATDVSQVARLPAAVLPPTIQPVGKHTLLDLLDPRFGLRETMAEKWEGMAFGPTLPDGRRTLILGVDNDYSPNDDNRFYVFAVDAADLPGFAWPY